MKTQPLRQDKHCLNCGTEVPERYCTHCGQENAVPHESFAHLVKHFVGDVVHYDSQFLVTLKYLLFRPGRLTKEYMAGKRVRYVNPIKLYIFISFVFFLVLAMLSHESGGHENGEAETHETAADTAHAAAPKKKRVEDIRSVSEVISVVQDSLKHGLNRTEDDEPLSPEDSVTLAKALQKIKKAKDDKSYRSLEEYDSTQRALPKDQRDGKMERYFTRRVLRMQGSYKDGDFEEALKHNIPKMMFVLLPLFALWLKIMYNWKRWYYTDHAIFALHVHCFAFVLLLISLVLDHYLDTDAFTGWGIVLLFVYLWLALKHTYQQSYRRSLLKAVLLLTGYSISFVFVFALFVVLLFAVIL